MLGSSMLMLSNSLPYDVHRNIHKMRFFNEPHPSLLSGATRVLPLVSNEVHKVHDPFQLDEGNISRSPRPPSSIRDILLKEGYYYEPSTTTHRPTYHHHSKRPKDPDKYLAVIPYKDVYKLFNTLNQYTKPKKVATTKKPKPTTKKATTKKPAKKETTMKKKKKKKKTVKHKTKVEVMMNHS